MIIKLTTLTIGISLILFSKAAFAGSEICKTSEGFIDTMETLNNTDGKGIGGTGDKIDEAFVYGQIYAYGSICVNGLRIKYDDNQLLEKGTLAKDLSLGQVVSVKASRIENSHVLKAVEIKEQNMLEGPITKIDEKNNLLYVMNQPVIINDQSVFSKLTLGQVIKISGIYNKENFLVAGFIHEGHKNQISGLLTKDTLNHYSVGKTPINFSKVKTSKPDDNSLVTISGTWNGANLVAEAVEAAFVKPQTNKPTYVSIEGYLSKIDEKNKRVTINNINLDVNDMSCGGEPLELGERLIAMGTQSQSGKIVIDGFVDQETPSLKFQK